MNKTLEYTALKIDNGYKTSCKELLVCEYPMTIFFNDKKIATLLCSPENLEELAIGFLRTENLIEDIEDFTSLILDKDKGVVYIETNLKKLKIRNFQSKKLKARNGNLLVEENIDKFLDSLCCNPVESEISIETDKIFQFMTENLNYSETFKNTGGVHSIALSDTKKVLVICEDVARHNAMDKTIGYALKNKISLKDKIMVLSGRVSLEMILKAARLEIPIIISKSAPTSLSVSLANKLNITLVGFVRNNRMNIYCNEQRIRETNIRER
ncbi:formate dehydrogenase accessory sulfurtransferase FdhD [Clostridium botulinum]|nr:formate dehydrogenase accessory sulfurtransferase FdhD [Clostridium botulinum]